MSIDNLVCNGQPLGALLKGSHGAANMLDQYGKQRGLTSAYVVQGCRDAAHPVIDLALAYIGNHGNVTPINQFEFDVVDAGGTVSQHVVMRNCVVTAWSLTSPEPPADPTAPALPDEEFFRIESTDVEFQAGGKVKPYRRTDPNKSE